MGIEFQESSALSWFSLSQLHSLDLSKFTIWAVCVSLGFVRLFGLCVSRWTV